MKDLITVVIPVYKVEKYINRCIDSVINQTYENLEIILVDDGSPDNCGRICDDYAKKDKRITVIHKKNGGLSDARNVGIDKANGKYITFIDSDDYVEKNYVSVLYNAIKKYKTKISIADNLIRYSSGKDFNNSSYKEYLFSEKEELEKMLWGERDLDNGAWTKLYDIELFDDVRYPVGKLYEDTATTYKIFAKCDKIAVVSIPIYNYMIRNDSITQCEFNLKKLQIIDATKIMTDDVRKRYPELNDACDRKMLWAYFSTLSQLASSNCENSDVEKELVSYIKSNYKGVLINKRTPKRDKFGIICLLFGYKFYKFIWNLYKKIAKKY